jgi:HAE1 family hydrophobic/amphiphilic exporter-1
MGMTVFSGMLIATILGVCLIPMLFVLVGKLTGSKPGPAPDTGPPAHAPEGGGH